MVMAPGQAQPVMAMRPGGPGWCLALPAWQSHDRGARGVLLAAPGRAGSVRVLMAEFPLI